MASRVVKNQTPNPVQRAHVNTGFISSLREGLSVSIEVPGLDEAIERLQKFANIGDTEAKRVRAGMRQTINLVRGKANETVPVGKTGQIKGTLFKAMKVWGEGNVTGNVGSNTSGLPGSKAVAPFVLEGGRKGRTGQAIRSTTEYIDPNARQKRRKVLGYGNVGEITPRRWLYHAYSRVKDQVNEYWVNAMKKIAEDLAKKG